jgi:predicted dehydrogenase
MVSESVPTRSEAVLVYVIDVHRIDGGVDVTEEYQHMSGSSLRRRDFLRRAALGLSASPLAAASARAARKSELVPRRRTAYDGHVLGLALVGLGNYATNQLAPALRQTSRCALKGIVTGTPEKARQWKQKYDIASDNVYDYDSFDSIADNDEIDIVYIVLPNAMHAEYTVRAAAAGKHVLCEKPMALSVDECEQMIDACRSANRKLSIGYRLHFEPHNREAMRFGRQGSHGSLRLLETSYGFRLGNPNQWRLRKALAGGGALMDVGIYAIQAARYVTGEEPTSVIATEHKTDLDKFSEVDETLFWQLRFPSGVVSNSTTTYAAYVERLYASADRGWLELSPAYSYGGIRGRTHEGSLDLPQINQQAAQMDDFALCIEEDRESIVPGEEGLRDMKVIEAIYRSAATGQEVAIG